jgi:hypothetical protein
LLCAQVFINRIPRTATDEDVLRLFGSCGKVLEVNLFKAFPGATTGKVSSILTFTVTSKKCVIPCKALVSRESSRATREQPPARRPERFVYSHVAHLLCVQSPYLGIQTLAVTRVCAARVRLARRAAAW